MGVFKIGTQFGDLGLFIVTVITVATTVTKQRLLSGK